MVQGMTEEEGLNEHPVKLHALCPSEESLA